ncbi:MAG: hypothetical protein ACK44M_08180 [Chloroflexus sp.]
MATALTSNFLPWSVVCRPYPPTLPPLGVGCLLRPPVGGGWEGADTTMQTSNDAAAPGGWSAPQRRKEL